MQVVPAGYWPIWGVPPGWGLSGVPAEEQGGCPWRDINARFSGHLVFRAGCFPEGNMAPESADNWLQSSYASFGRHDAIVRAKCHESGSAQGYAISAPSPRVGASNHGFIDFLQTHIAVLCPP